MVRLLSGHSGATDTTGADRGVLPADQSASVAMGASAMQQQLDAWGAAQSDRPDAPSRAVGLSGEAHHLTRLAMRQRRGLVSAARATGCGGAAAWPRAAISGTIPLSLNHCPERRRHRKTGALRSC